MRAADGDENSGAAPNPVSAAEKGEPDERLFIASLEKGLRVLEAFADVSTDLGLQDIVAATGLGKSAVQRLVYTLFQLGYLQRDPLSRRYKMSSKAYLRVFALSSVSKLVQQAHDSLAIVNKRCGDTCALAVAEGNEVVILTSILGRHIDSLNVAVGMRFQAHRVPSGRVLAACLPKEEARFILGKHLDALTDELAAIRRSGVCVAEDINVPGHLSISAPVFDARGRAVAAVNVSTLKSRYPADVMREPVIRLVVDAAAEISARLGYPP